MDGVRSQEDADGAVGGTERAHLLVRVCSLSLLSRSCSRALSLVVRLAFGVLIFPVLGSLLRYPQGALVFVENRYCYI